MSSFLNSIPLPQLVLGLLKVSNGEYGTEELKTLFELSFLESIIIGLLLLNEVVVYIVVLLLILDEEVVVVVLLVVNGRLRLADLGKSNMPELFRFCGEFNGDIVQQAIIFAVVFVFPVKLGSYQF